LHYEGYGKKKKRRFSPENRKKRGKRKAPNTVMQKF